MKWISYILIILLFCGPCVLYLCGWNVETPGSIFYAFYPSIYVLGAFLCVKGNKHTNQEYKIEFLTIFVALFYFFIGRFIVGVDGNYGRILFNGIILPCLYYIYFNGYNKVKKKNLRNFIIFIYLINSILAISERIVGNNLFPTDLVYQSAIDNLQYNNDIDITMFRSNALLGHPLANGFITSIVMGFILISNIKVSYKYSLCIIGFIALFCFNTRASILVSGFSIIVYLLKDFLFGKNVSVYKRIGLIFLLFVGYFIVRYLIENGFGGRLFMSENFDDSSVLARFLAFDVLSYFDWQQILFGLDSDTISKITIMYVGNDHLENWLVTVFLNLGVFTTILFIVLFYYIFKQSKKGVNTFDWWFVFAILMAVGWSFPGFTTGVPAIALFFVCLMSFNKNIVRKNKYETI